MSTEHEPIATDATPVVGIAGAIQAIGEHFERMGKQYERKPRGVPRTYQFAMAAGHDAASHQMRKRGDTKWNRDDWNLMCETVDAILGPLPEAKEVA